MVQEPAAKGRRSFTYGGTDLKYLLYLSIPVILFRYPGIPKSKTRLQGTAKTFHVGCPGLILHRTFNVDSKQKTPVWQTHRGNQEPKKYHSGLIGFGELSFKLVSAGNLDLVGKYALSCKLERAQKGDARGCMFSWRKTIQAKILVNLQNLVNYTNSPSRIQGI